MVPCWDVVVALVQLAGGVGVMKLFVAFPAIDGLLLPGGRVPPGFDISGGLAGCDA